MHKNVRLPIAYHVIGHPVDTWYATSPCTLFTFYSIWATETIKWTRLRAHTITIGINWENLLV